jgi:hypothetical protein
MGRRLVIFLATPERFYPRPGCFKKAGIDSGLPRSRNGVIIGLAVKLGQENWTSATDHCASAVPLKRRPAKAKSYNRKNELRKRRATPKWVALIWPALDSMPRTPGQQQFIG